MSKTMEFKSTQKLFNPNEQIPKINNTIKSLKKDEKKKEITIFRCNKTYYEILKDSLIDHIYLTTAQPSNFQRLATLHLILGQSESLADSCRLLGYYSLNEFIRQHKHIFVEFLEIFVTKNNKKTIATDPPFILNYYNKKICYNECLSKSMREAMDEESKPDRDRYLITFEQTKYFEFHNSLDYIDGRKSLRKLFKNVESKDC
uniref:Uncharacterized protein n=1 Tax=Panagrolaimus superbus TaxID=310955 RepID=A0A914YDF3_9BILA